MTVHVEYQSLGNTKISSNDIHNKNTAQTKKCRHLPKGRLIGIPEMIHKMLGYPDVEHSYSWIDVDTGPFESRGRTKVRLDKRGNVLRTRDISDVRDAVTTVTDSYSCRAAKLPSRQFTKKQSLLMQASETTCDNQDKISLFGVRPVEINNLVRSVKQYFEWFAFEDRAMKTIDIMNGLNDDVRKCKWIDGLGRRVFIRRSALKDFGEHLKSLSNSDLKDFEKMLKFCLLHMIDGAAPDMERLFVLDDNREDYPIAVFSKVSPDMNVKFVLHVLLILGQFDTELDIKAAGSLKQSFVYCGLIRKTSLDNDNDLREDLNLLMARIIDEVLPYQPITEQRIDNFIVKGYALMESTLFDSSIPMYDYPPCLATEIEFSKEKEFAQEWNRLTKDQLRSIMMNLKHIQDIPSVQDIVRATKDMPLEWDPLNSIIQFDTQSDDSYTEQQFSIELTIRSIEQYKQSYHQRITKGLLYNGVPGAGKTFVLQCAALYAMTQGLRCVTTSLMALRSKVLGGMNMHQLFKLTAKRTGNLYRLAQVC